MDFILLISTKLFWVRKKEDPFYLLPISIIHGCDMNVDMDEDDTYIDNLLGLVELSEELGESGIDDESLSQEARANLLLWWKWEEDKVSGVNYLPPKTRQAKNVYDRRSAWEFVLSWDEKMFSRHSE